MKLAPDHPVDILLPLWGAWCRRENRSGLGYAQVQYAEMIARATSATNWSPRIDTDVIELDRIIRERVAPQPRVVLLSRYRDQLQDKQVAAKFSISRSHLNRMLHLAILPQLRHEWDCSHSLDIAPPCETRYNEIS